MNPLLRTAFLTALVCGLALGVVSPPARAAVFNPKSFTLANGMQVVVVTNRRAPVIAHMVWYKIGAADESPGHSGIAHFLEHLMFKGTKTVPPGQFSKIVARNGGNDNAFTTYDYTAYFEKVARDKLELVMRMEADRMRNLVLTDAEVLPERDVVLEERRMRTDNDPSAQLYEAARNALFLNHPYRIPIIGWEREIKQLTTQDALSFYHRYYEPNNAILIVAGDVTLEELKPLAEKYFGVLKPGPKIVRHRPLEPRQVAARWVELDSRRVGQPTWSRTYLAPCYARAAGNEAYALQVLEEILGGGTTSRLYRALVVEQGVAASAGASYNPDALDYGTFDLAVSPRPGKDLESAKTALLAEIARVLKDGVTEKEVAEAKRRLQASAIYARDSLSAAPNIIGRALTTGQTLDDVENWPERIGAVTRAEVDAAARKVLVVTSSVTAILRPAPGKE